MNSVVFASLSLLMLLSRSSCFGSDYYDQVVDLTTKYAERFASENDMKCFHVGICTDGRVNCCTSFGIYGHERVTLDAAKLFAHRCIGEYYAFLKAQNDVETYFTKIRKPYAPFAPGLYLDYIGVRIGYWTEEMDRMMPPYIAEVRFFNKTYHYYQADPKTQALVEVFQETAEEKNDLR